MAKRHFTTPHSLETDKNMSTQRLAHNDYGIFVTMRHYTKAQCPSTVEQIRLCMAMRWSVTQQYALRRTRLMRLTLRITIVTRKIHPYQESTA